MKKIILIILLCILLLEGIALAALSYDETYYMQHRAYLHSGSSITDPLYLFMNETIGYLEGSTGFTSVYFTPQTSTPTAVEGVFYFDNDANGLKIYNGSSWQNIDVAGGTSLDASYDLGSTITVDASAITLTAGLATNNGVLTLIQSNTGAYECLKITNAGTDPSIEIDGAGTGDDITGTGDLWTVSETGIGSFAGLIIGGTDIVFENGDTFANSTDDYFVFSTNDKEDFILDLSGSTSDEVKLSSTSGATIFDFGTFVTVQGISTITGSVAGDFVIEVTSDNAGEDLIIRQLGSGAYSILIESAGTGLDSISLQATKGIDIDSNDDMAITNTATTSEDDLIIAQVGAVDASLLITSGGTGTDAVGISTTHASGDIKINSGDKIDIDAVGEISIVSAGGSGKDILITNTAGSIAIWAGEDNSAAMLLEVDGSTASVLTIFNDTGTAAGSITLLSDVGGIDITAEANTAGDILIDANDVLTLLSASISDNGLYLHANGGVNEGIKIHSDQGTSADSIELLSDVGGITITAAANTAGDILIDANDIITLLSASIAADGIYLHTDGGATEGILLRSDQGTSVDSIELLSDVGGITITTADTTAGDILIDANDVITIVSKSLSDNGIIIETDGHDDEGIYIHSDQGTSADSIELISDEGGITITASAVANTKMGLVVKGTALAGCLITEGGGLYASFESTQNTNGLVKAVGTWLDITAGTPTAGCSLIALDVGVYQAQSGVDLTDATVKVINMEYQGTSNGALDSTSVYWFNFNSAGHHPTAWFHCNGGNNIAFTANTTHSTGNGDQKLGAIAIQIDAINGGGLSYIYVYSDAGS